MSVVVLARLVSFVDENVVIAFTTSRVVEVKDDKTYGKRTFQLFEISLMVYLQIDNKLSFYQFLLQQCPKLQYLLLWILSLLGSRTQLTP